MAVIFDRYYRMVMSVALKIAGAFFGAEGRWGAPGRDRPVKLARKSFGVIR